MTSLTDRLRETPPLLLDGGLGTALIARGLPPGKPPDAWTLDRPEILLEVHRAYVTAGSEAVHANTFGANAVRLALHGYRDRCRDLNLAAVRLARDSGARYILADVGPTGTYLPPVGTAETELWRRAFREQGQILSESGADGLHIETMTDLREARIALDTLRSAAPTLPVLVSLTFERKKRGFFTAMGDPLVPSLTQLLADGADAVGANCSLTSTEMRDLAREARAALDGLLLFQPNAGQPRLTPEGVVYDQDPSVFAEEMIQIAALGVAAVGGCCGTDSRFIAALRRRLPPRAGIR